MVVVGARVVTLVVVALMTTLAPDAVFAQCAMCRSVLESPEGLQLVEALRSGILVLLAAPFVLFVCVATLAVRSQRQRRERQQ